MSFPDFVPKHLRELAPVPLDKPLDVLGGELGTDLIQMGMNENPFGPSPRAVQAMRSALENSNRYPDDTGYKLRQKLADHFKVSMDEVILGVGASDLLGVAYNAVLSPEAEVLTSEGSFIVYYLLAASTGMRIVCVPLKDHGFDLDAMAQRITPRTRLIIIANPNNPTGTIIRRKQLEAFIHKVPNNVLLVMDEAYFEYVDDKDYPNSLDYLRSGKSILTMRTFSKVYGLAGVRIGYGISSRDVIETLYKVRMTFSLSALAIAAGLAAWDDQEHVRLSVERNRAEREFLSRELSRRAVKYVPSFTNFIFLDLGRPADAVGDALLRQGIVARPLAGWGIPTGLRVSIGTHEQNEKFLTALEKVL
jgi:histidinol-phosphate aminotransferase